MDPVQKRDTVFKFFFYKFPTDCIMASTLVMVIAFVPQAVMTEAQHGQHFFAHIRRRPWYVAIKPSTRALVRRMMQTTYNKL